MKNFKNTDLIEVYMDYDYKWYASSSINKGEDYIFYPKDENGEPIIERVPYGDIVYINRNSNVIKKRILRFTEEFEEDVYSALKINFKQIEKDSYTREDIHNMILNPNSYGTNGVINIIKDIKEVKVVEMFLSELIGLKNENCYDISERIEMYIKARIEELKEGIKQSELEVQEPKISLGVIEESEDIKKESVQEVTKPTATNSRQRGRASKK